MNMDNFGHAIRRLRAEKNVQLVQVAAALGMDAEELNKIETGTGRATRAQVLKLANFFGANKEKLLVEWLSDKLVYELGDEDVALDALKVAEARLQYGVVAKPGKAITIGLIQQILKQDGRVAAAWLFGSFARGDFEAKSDVDIMIEMNDAKNYSLFDILSIAHSIEAQINRKVDLVEKGCLKGFALRTASNDMIKIYG